ncbi:MAG: VOC family protein, partial [Candidatus Acidiferrum sp.]
MGQLSHDPSNVPTVRLDRENPYLRLQAVTVFVRNLDRSIDFFVKLLGFHLVFDARAVAGRAYAVLAPPDGTSNLALVMP